MAKRALIVGINSYDNFNPLNGCEADAAAMHGVLARHADDTKNFDCQTFTTETYRITKAFLRKKWTELFQNFSGDVLFYFSGHGSPTELGGHIVTQDGTKDDFGLPMHDVLALANMSSARSVLVILDCCFSGSAGNPSNLPADHTQLREGVTILAASRPTQVAIEIGELGIFTSLLLGALKGGAADVRGRVSAASIYAYVEAALGAWDQRPLYKSHAAHLEPVRVCEPKVPDQLLRELPSYFDAPGSKFQMDMTFEETNGCAKPENVEIFKKFKALQIAGLLRCNYGSDLYWTAERSGFVLLTPLGEFYRQLVIAERI